MNKKVVIVVALIIIVSPWILIGSVFKDILYIIAGLILLIAMVDISKKKKDNDYVIS